MSPDSDSVAPECASAFSTFLPSPCQLSSESKREWQLKTADPGEPWTEVGNFESATDAARKIIELEEYPVSAIFFTLFIETKAGSEEEAFAHLEHSGRCTGRLYVIKRAALASTPSIRVTTDVRGNPSFSVGPRVPLRRVCEPRFPNQ